MEEIDLRVDKAKVETVAHKWWRRIFHKSSLEFSFIIRLLGKYLVKRFPSTILQTISRDYDYLGKPGTDSLLLDIKKRDFHPKLLLERRKSSIGPLWKKCFFRMFSIRFVFLKLQPLTREIFVRWWERTDIKGYVTR